ncbi:ABC transporter ATP-binding protein [Planosporangium flavigriseum]|uniref:ABC-type quaternary amine transporter n=1 Tax=Planosporangium flavigriseum TaxID=373681 RepID=A0A8J3LNS4_9ACTN|nr:ABC transporter ATP-binding protein [Planosporangium flavigriseum]NJC66064.1 ABC transporter ATP-binding protein [Planosporangium flavigriseum]GIG75097.1 branched-chain amino acid ABC transporter substrate-binding protein [Planosporangium flavigriseum]
MTQVTATSHGADKTGGAQDSVTLRVRDLRKSFGGNEVLRGIDLDVRTGEFLTLLGPSGSGKTTLLRIIAGFESHTSGEMLLRGRDIAGLSPSERGLGMVFQQYALFPHMTVADNVAYGLRMRGWDRGKIGKRVSEMLEIVGLPHLSGRKPRQLSGGQQQRVAFARALAYAPQLLLMDEPLGALDRSLRLQLEEEIKRVHRQMGTTVIYVTHDQEEALVLSDRIAIMEEGRFAGLDTPTALYQRPPSTFVAKFFANANLIPATASADGSIECRGSAFSTQTDLRGPVSLAVRPRSLRLEPVTNGLRLSGAVVETLLLGDDRQVKFDVPGVGPMVALVDARQQSELEPGAAVTLHAPAEEITVLEA